MLRSPFLLFWLKILNWLGRPFYLILCSIFGLFGKIGSLILFPFLRLKISFSLKKVPPKKKRRVSVSQKRPSFKLGVKLPSFSLFTLLKEKVLGFFKNLRKVFGVLARAIASFFGKILDGFAFLLKIPFPKISFRRYWLGLFLGIALFTLTSWALYLNILKDLPSPQRLIDRPLALTTKIYDRNGELLYKIYHEENRTLIPLSEIPEFVVEATIAVEDREFYNHSGLSLRGIARAIKHNLTNPDKAPVGGSTITQQLIKNALLGSEKTWQRKIKEAILAVLVEERFSKDEILQMYFNEVPYGGTAYGIEEAAQKYFGKSIREVSLSEGALLAGLPAGPTRFSPFGAYPTIAKERQERTISSMVEAGYLNEEEARKASQESLRLKVSNGSLLAPHFVFYVKDELVRQWGEEVLEQGGLEVVTSLDLDLQVKVEEILRQELNQIAHLGVSNGGALVIRPESGEILAMVGSKDYFDFSNDGNVNVTLSERQPGSSIKVVNYARALQKGFTAATVIPDTPITFKSPYQEPYSPQNYDSQFHGNVTLRTALGSSFNVPAVKVLSAIGVEEMIEQGKMMGITTWEDRSRFGLSLTLGGGEVKMIDLAQVYSVLANLGKKTDLTPFLEVKPSIGENNLYDLKYQAGGDLVLDPGIAFLLNDILSDNFARAQAFGLHSLLDIPGKKVAVKTGTSNSLRDNWAIGYTSDFLVAVWVGNNDNTPMSRIASGITGATPIWRQITDLMLEEYPNTGWEIPEDIVKTSICRTTGTLSCEGCPQVGEEYFVKGTIPEKHCSPSWFIAKDQSEETKNQ